MINHVSKTKLTYVGAGCAFGLFISTVLNYVRFVPYTFPMKQTNLRSNRNNRLTFYAFNAASQTYKKPSVPQILNDTHTHKDNTTLADDLFRRVRVLCWIMTCPRNLQSKAYHVKQTWGKRCNILLFMSTEANDSFPAIRLNVSEGREHLTAKSMAAFKYVYDHHFQDADWFMKADDDTYVILENLRYFLVDKNPNNPVYYGNHFKVIVDQGYHSGGAGYVLSKKALAAWHEVRLKCRDDGGAEDVEIGKCLRLGGVNVGNNTDAYGRSRFHCFDIRTHLKGNYPKWYKAYNLNNAKKNAISDYAISFHYVKPEAMYWMEFYVYHLRPYGIISAPQELNQPKA